MRNSILNEIKEDLSDNYRNDDNVLSAILDDVITDALMISNRGHKLDVDNQLSILKSNIKKAVKTIYLQRGTEDVKSNGQNGLSNAYVSAVEEMGKDILRQNKRLFA